MERFLVGICLCAWSTAGLRGGGLRAAVPPPGKGTGQAAVAFRQAAYVTRAKPESAPCHNSSSALENHTVSFKAQAATVNSSRQDVEIMMCIPARSAPWLQLMRKSWLDDAIADRRFGHLVFIPSPVPYGMDAAGEGLQLMRLTNWVGDVASFQGAFTGAIVPCSAHTKAKWYAMLDDDILVFPSALAAVVGSFNSHALVVYGRKGEPNLPKRIIYGGLMLMSARTTQKVVSNIDSMFEAVASEAVRRGLTVYNGTHGGFNIDHYFSILVGLLGGHIQELDQIAELRPEVWWNKGLPTGEIIAVHHMTEADFKDYLQHPFLKQSSSTMYLRSWCAQRCAGKCV